MATVTQDGKVIEEETTPAQFWKNAGLKEYDHTIFEGEEVTYKALMKNASFLHASALVYEMKNGETWETKIAREGIDKAAADKKLGEYGIDTIRWFQNNSASTTRTAYQVGKYARDDQKVAMLYMMQAYEHSKMSLPGVGNALVMGALDPLNALAFLTGATTLGGSVAAVQAAKETGKLALRTLLIAGFQAHMTKKGAILLGSSAAEGALAAGIQRDREQAIETQKSEIGDKTIQYKQEYSWGDTGARALGGAVIGTTLNIAGRGIGNTFQWGKFKWDHRNGAITPDITPANTATNTVDAATGTTKDATTPDASKVPGTDIVPGKTRLMPAQDATTWMHTLLKRDPFQKVNEWAAIFTEKNGSKAAVQHVPLHYFFRQFYTPIEKHVDDAINQSGLIDKILDVDKKLVDIRLKMAKTANSTDKAALEKEAEKIILKFAQNKNNKKSFSDIRDAVAPLGREIEAYNTVGYAEPRAGFIDSQKKALIKLANHVERLCDLAQNPQDFLKEYKENRQLFGDQDAISITGAFQHYTALAAETRLRIKTRDHLGWAGDWSKPFARKTSKLGPAYERVITNGEDGILAGGAYGRYQPRIENIRKQERGINYGYYNDRIRTISIENNPDSPDNIENISIILTNFHKLNKDANNQLKLGTEGEFSGYFIDGYKAGREADMLRALDRLVSTQGQDGSIYTVPRKALTAIAESAMRLGWDKDPHFAVYLDAIGDLLKVKQSPEKYAQRYMEKLFEKYTKWHFEGDVAAGKDITGVPGKNYFYKTPRAYITAHTLATLSGRRVVPNLEADGSVNKSNPVKLKWDIWNAPPEETTGVKAIWHNLTARNSLITFAAAPLTVPLRVAYGATTGIIKPVLNHTWKGLALAGLTAAGASGAYEYVTDEEAGFGRWALKAGINTVDTFAGTPLRLALSASEKGFNAQAWIIEQATKGNVSLPRIDLDSWGMNPWDYHLPTAWLDEPFFVSTAQATSLNASFTPAAATNTGATMTNANTGNPPVSSALPAVTTSPEAQAARDNLLSLGQRTSDLYETVVREGWTDANKSNFAALQADYNTHAPAAKNLGAHAEEIASRAGNLLNH